MLHAVSAHFNLHDLFQFRRLWGCVAFSFTVRLLRMRSLCACSWFERMLQCHTYIHTPTFSWHFLCLSVCLFLSLSVSVCLSVCLSVSLSLFVYLSVCLPVCLSVCLLPGLVLTECSWNTYTHFSVCLSVSLSLISLFNIHAHSGAPHTQYISQKSVTLKKHRIFTCHFNVLLRCYWFQK